MCEWETRVERAVDKHNVKSAVAKNCAVNKGILRPCVNPIINSAVFCLDTG